MTGRGTWVPETCGRGHGAYRSTDGRLDVPFSTASRWFLTAALVHLAAAGAGGSTEPDWPFPLAGATDLGVAIAWAAITVPALYPQLNPLPGLTSDKIRVLRERWRGR